MRFENASQNPKKLPIKLENWSYWAYPELMEFEGDCFLISDTGDDIYLSSREILSDKWVVMDEETHKKFFKKTKEGILCLECMTVLASWDKHDKRICNCNNKVTISGGDKKLEVSAVNSKFIKYVEIKVEI